jgi:hypothetical protein
MELDRTRIAIRERGYLDVLDLALCVFRAHAGPLTLTILAGVAPMFALNWWLLADSITDEAFELDSAVMWSYTWRLLALTFLEMPLAAAPTTLYLGDALFVERPTAGQIVRNLWATLPQMALLQLIPRALVVLPAVLSDEPLLVGFAVMVLVLGVPLHYAVWPYLTEVILLERNPLLRRGARDKGTLARCSMLHGRYRIELFGQWILALLFGSAWVAALWGGGWYLWINLIGKLTLAAESFTILLPAALWVVVSFFTIARYLGYLDLRIKTEGWEIELRMRAEAQRLTKAVV